ncbi:MAG: protein-export membrane protein SecD [Candidatus Tectomicrobia bacterium RIFCSPLOWO2_12_FULL_69_37]|nr:MAG: protein-export membrane protein SecD [Candidatus Tectomicrobia bacterium RIFCSPLOWO2_02_FULL_70_19]OGL61447.1 MAG: protein-export membrane protein SecD [Candidatus Tectomicrobia bacterium RIFCSPLOWO2_12_FULL_69_37]
MKGMGWRAALIAVVVGAALFYLYPPKDRLNLGLDLQGGIHLVLEVQAEKAVDAKIDRYFGEIRGRLGQDDIRTQAFRRDQRRITVGLVRENDRSRFLSLMAGYPDLTLQSTEGAPPTFTYAMSDQQARHIMEQAVAQAIETLRNRVDQFGVREPVLQRQGERRIIVQLPGVQDPARAKALIGKTAQLEFKMVDESANPGQAEASGPPEGLQLLFETRRDPATGQTTRQTPLLVKREALLTGDNLTDARVEIGDRFNQPYVSIAFDSVGAQTFDRVTAANVGKRLAIILDGVIYSAPVIQERIGGGRAQITGSFTLEEARDLAIALRAGALPAPVQTLEERTVGPSLGSDSIRQGVISIIAGFLLVMAFMCFYYKWSGAVSVMALALNLVLLMGALGFFQATLTLPGIAGIILTVGMAVDANVLIFERIREELRLGKTVRSAVDAGYSKAFLTILDSNVTTLVAALVLLQFGTGPIKGFAITLSVGLIASMFTAIFVTRLVYDFVLSRQDVRSLSI